MRFLDEYEMVFEKKAIPDKNVKNLTAWVFYRQYQDNKKGAKAPFEIICQENN